MYIFCATFCIQLSLMSSRFIYLSLGTSTYPFGVWVEWPNNFLGLLCYIHSPKNLKTRPSIITVLQVLSLKRSWFMSFVVILRYNLIDICPLRLLFYWSSRSLVSQKFYVLWGKRWNWLINRVSGLRLLFVIILSFVNFCFPLTYNQRRDFWSLVQRNLG